MMRRRAGTPGRARARRCLAGLLALLVAGCGRERAAGNEPSLRHLRVSFSPHISFGPLMIARDEGFFREEGLDVEFVTTMQPEETLVAVVTGDIDVRPGALHAAFLSAIAQGAPIRIVAGMGTLSANACTYFGIVLRRGLDSSGTPPLRTMRTSQDGVTRYLVERMLATRGMTLDGVQTVRLPEPTMAPSIATGAIDAGAASEPVLSRMTEVAPLWIAAQDAVPDFQWAVIVFGERLLTRERDTGQRFLRAYQRGVARYLQGKTPRNVEIIARGTGDSPDAVRAACWLDFRPDSRIEWPSIAAFQDWATTSGYMERVITPTQGLDSGFLAALGRR